MTTSTLYDAAAHWQLAFDAAQRATELGITPPLQAELAGEQVALRHERVEVAAALECLARMCSVFPAPRLPQGPVTPRDLGLPTGTRACILDLDGVLTDGWKLDVEALPGARRFLETARYAGIGRAVLSERTSTTAMLELAGLDTLVDTHIDADALRREGLRARPAPDAVLAACERLGAAPARAVTVTHTPAGAVAGLAAGTTVVGIAARDEADLLSGFGAHRVVRSLGGLLDPRLRSSADRR